MKLNLSCTDFSFPLLSHDQALAVVSLLGLKGVDIGLFEAHGHLKPSRELVNPERSGRELKCRVAKHGMQVADVFLQIHHDFTQYAINHPNANRRIAARREFIRLLDYATAAGTKHLTILPGVPFKGEPRRASFARSIAELRWRTDQARDAKLQPAVEPHVGSIIDTPTRALDLVKLVPGLGLTLDYAHFTRGGSSDKCIEPLVPYATHFHARSARPGRLQAPMKENTINFARIAELLRKQKFGGWIALEYVWIDWERCNQVDVLSETIMLRDALQDAHKNLAA